MNGDGVNDCAENNGGTSDTPGRYMKYAFLFTANALHFSIMNKFYFYFLRGGVYGVSSATLRKRFIYNFF